MSTLVNLDSVFVISSECFSCNSSLGQRSNLAGLHKVFQVPSARQLRFIRDVGDLSSDRHATFLHMFPNRDTLISPPIQCFKDKQSCKQVARETLACPRKLVPLNARAGWNNESNNNPRSSYVPGEPTWKPWINFHSVELNQVYGTIKVNLLPSSLMC